MVKSYEEVYKDLNEEKQRVFNEVESLTDQAEALHRVDSLLRKVKEAADDSEGDFTSLVQEIKDKRNEIDTDRSGSESTGQQDQPDEPQASSPSQSEEEQVSGSESTNGTGETETAGDEQSAAAETADTESEHDASSYYNELAKKAERLLDEKDWGYVEHEFELIETQWSEGPAGLDENALSELRQRINKAKEDFEQRRKEHYEALNEQKQKNLERKKELLEELQKTIDQQNWQANKQVNRIKGEWENLKPLPRDEAEALEEQFNKLIATFDENKVDYLVKKKEKEEENLAGKLLILDKMKNLVEGLDDQVEDWGQVHRTFKNLQKQWKKIGRVPNEKNQEIWDRYNTLQDQYFEAKFKYDAEYRKRIEKNLESKKTLCEEAEALVDADDLAWASREINRLHKRWKKVGNLPQNEENELWNRFKTATNEFNERKANNLETLKEQEEQNYEEKLKLIEKAKEIQETTDWKNGADQMQALMEEWKKIGPVPKQHSQKIWKEFKGAMDVFYERRREHFRERRKEEKENLKKKREIIDKLNELGKAEDPLQAVEDAKKLQAEFKEIGFVPIKQKNKVWKQYREACDVIYDRFRNAKSQQKEDQKLDKKGVAEGNKSEIRKRRNEIQKLRKESKKLEDEIIQFKESKTFFTAKNNEGNSILDEIDKKIENAEESYNKKQERIDTLNQEIEDLKQSADKQEDDNESNNTSDEEETTEQ